MRIEKDYEELLGLLNKHKVKYCIIGKCVGSYLQMSNVRRHRQSYGLKLSEDSLLGTSAELRSCPNFVGQDRKLLLRSSKTR